VVDDGAVTFLLFEYSLTRPISLRPSRFRTPAVSGGRGGALPKRSILAPIRAPRSPRDSLKKRISEDGSRTFLSSRLPFKGDISSPRVDFRSDGISQGSAIRASRVSASPLETSSRIPGVGF